MRPRALAVRRPKPGPARVRPAENRQRAGVPASQPGPRVDIGATSDAGVPGTIPPRPSDPAALAAWAGSLLGQIHGLENRIGLDFYRIGARMQVLQDRTVYTALGFRSFGQLLEAEGVMSRFWGIQLARIASEYSHEQARTLGVSKAWAIISYAAATGQKPSEVLEGNESIDGKPLASSSVRELHAAAARERARRRGLLGTPAHEAAEKAVRQISRVVRKRGARDARVSLVLRGTSWRIRVEVPAELAVAAIVGSIARASGAPSGIARGASRAAPRKPGRGPPR